MPPPVEGGVYPSPTEMSMPTYPPSPTSPTEIPIPTDVPSPATVAPDEPDAPEERGLTSDRAPGSPAAGKESRARGPAGDSPDPDDGIGDGDGAEPAGEVEETMLADAEASLEVTTTNLRGAQAGLKAAEDTIAKLDEVTNRGVREVFQTRWARETLACLYEAIQKKEAGPGGESGSSGRRSQTEDGGQRPKAGKRVDRPTKSVSGSAIIAAAVAADHSHLDPVSFAKKKAEDLTGVKAAAEADRIRLCVAATARYQYRQRTLVSLRQSSHEAE